MEWKYGYATLDGKELAPNNEMSDVVPGELQRFLDDAGDKGWELCGILPYPGVKSSDQPLTVIFKRARSIVGSMPTETSSNDQRSS